MRKGLIVIFSIMLIIVTFGCQNKNQKMMQEGKYKEAYQNYCEDNKQKEADECILLWEKYILEQEKIDEEFKDIRFFSEDNREKYWNNIKEYLDKKVIPNNEESKLIIYLIDNCDEVYTYIHAANFTSRTLKDLMNNEEKIWYIPQWEIVSYDQYYSQEHFYTEDNLNKMLSADKNNFAYFDADEDGYKVVISYIDENYSTKYKEQYIICGDYRNYLGDNFVDCDDGYWHYYLADNMIKRFSYKGESEDIYQLKDGEILNNMFVIDHDIMYCLVENNDEYIILRIYLPEIKIDIFDDVIDKEIFVDNAGIVVPHSSKYLQYCGYNPKYLEKVEELKNDKEKCIQLFNKYDIEVSEIEIDEMFENKKSMNVKLRSVLLKEYGIDIIADYMYNIETKETTYKENKVELTEQGVVVY